MNQNGRAARGEALSERDPGGLGPSGTPLTAPRADAPRNNSLCHFLASKVCPCGINSNYGAIPFTSDSEHAD